MKKFLIVALLFCNLHIFSQTYVDLNGGIDFNKNTINGMVVGFGVSQKFNKTIASFTYNEYNVKEYYDPRNISLMLGYEVGNKIKVTPKGGITLMWHKIKPSTSLLFNYGIRVSVKIDSSLEVFLEHIYTNSNSIQFGFHIKFNLSKEKLNQRFF